MYCDQPTAAQGYRSDGGTHFVYAGALQRVRGSLLGCSHPYDEATWVAVFGARLKEEDGCDIGS